MIDPVYALAALGSAASLIAITACVRARTDRKNLWWAQDAWQRDCVVYENRLNTIFTEANILQADLYTAENEVSLLRSKLTRSPGARAKVMAQRAETTRRLVEKR